MKTFTMGFDIGTLSSKAVLVDLEGNVIAEYQNQHEVEVQKAGYQEESMENWWNEFKEAVEHFLKFVDSPDQIKTIGVTGLIPGCCPVDNDGNPIGKAILHTDVRAVDELEFINNTLNSSITHGHMLPKLLWIKENQPDNYKNIWKVFVPHGFVAYKLTGEDTMDYDSASMIGGIFDEDKLGWKSEIIDKLGITADILPELHASSDIAGSVTEEAAKETGLSTLTKVIVGVGDTFASMLGGGAYSANHLMLYLGTSATVIYAEGSPENYIRIPHYGEGKGHFVGRIVSFGESISHLRDVLRYDGWKELDASLKTIPSGSDGLWYLPHFKLQTDRSFFGPDAEFMLGFRGLHSQFHIYNAMIEGIAYNIKSNIVNFHLPVNHINIFGGGANSKEICQVIADVIGQDLHFNKKSSTAFGIAFLAAYGNGDIKEFSILGDVWFGDSELISPNVENVEIYKGLYEQYRTFRETIMKLDTDTTPLK